MISDGRPTVFVRAALTLAWRGDTKIASKLSGFSATEAGSALDMLQAAEACEDPRLRRLFFRHALDEARHAEMFQAAARRLNPDASAGDYDLIHATRQNLWAQHGLVRFLAFVHLAETRAATRFAALRRRFADRPEIADLFDSVMKDERFHVAYSRRLLDELVASGKGAEVRRALFSVRVAGAWQAWRRAGRRLGDFVSRGILMLLYVSIVPLFALLQRVSGQPGRGWQKPANPARTIEQARGQS